MSTFSFSFQNFDLIAVGAVIAAIGILGFIAFYSNQKSITNRTFLAFSLLTIIYSLINYFSYKFDATETALWFLRFTLFFSVWHAFCFFQLFYVFPEEHVEFSKFYRFFIQPFVIISSIIALSPFTFIGVGKIISSEAPNPIIGPGMLLFALTTIGLILGGLRLLYKKMAHAIGNERWQFKFIFIGAIIMFALIIIFNIIFPAVFYNVRFIPLTPISIFPFIIFTTYAIRKYQLFNIKVITTEVVSFLIVISTLFEIILSKSTAEVILRSGIFVVILTFTIILIRSVLKEVEQRERLQTLSAQLEETNAKLEVLDKRKSEFVSIAGHQLRTPLTIIKGYVSLVLEGSFGATKKNKKLRDALTIVANATNQLEKLVSDLLDLSRIESGKMHYEFKETDFARMVESIVKEYTPAAKEKKLKLMFENNAKDAAPFLFDPDKMREVAVNLIDNAMKYSTEGDIVVGIELTNQNQALRLSVKDHGLGIRKEDISQLFIKFNRLPEAKSMQPNGSGIGLFFVKRLIEDHGGRIGVESPGPGQGSTFWAEIPIRKN